MNTPKWNGHAGFEDTTLLINLYHEARAQADVPTLSLRETIMGPLPAVPSPFLDVLHRQSIEQHGNVTAAENCTIAALRRVAEARRGETLLPLVSSRGRAADIATLMRENYPQPYHYLADTSRIEKLLNNPHSETLSFLALDDNGQAIAATRGYVGHSSIHPEVTDNTARLNHFLVNESQRHSLLGIRLFRDFLLRVNDTPATAVELLARNETAYRGFKAGSTMAKVLHVAGYTIEDYGTLQTYGDGDQKDHLSGIRLFKSSSSSDNV